MGSLPTSTESAAAATSSLVTRDVSDGKGGIGRELIVRNEVPDIGGGTEGSEGYGDVIGRQGTERGGGEGLDVPVRSVARRRAPLVWSPV